MCVWESVTLRLQRASNIHVTNWSKTTFSSSLYLAFASFSNTAVWAHILCMCNLLSSWGTLGQQKQVSEWKWVSYTGNSRQLDSVTDRFLCKWFLQSWHHYSAKTSWKKTFAMQLELESGKCIFQSDPVAFISDGRITTTVQKLSLPW